MKNQSIKNKSNGNNGLVIGLVIILIGCGYLIKQMFPGVLPRELFTWKAFLILLGIVSGIINRFKGMSWIILIGIGTFALTYELFAGYVNIKRYIFPVFLILIGWMIYSKSKKNRNFDESNYEYKAPEPRLENPSSINAVHSEKPSDTPIPSEKVKSDNNSELSELPLLPPLDKVKENEGRVNIEFDKNEFKNERKNQSNQQYALTDQINVNSYFGGNETTISSRDFQGGSINCAFGGVDVDLHDADFEGTIFIDIFCLCGGVEISIPQNWKVVNEVSALLGSMEDSRKLRGLLDYNKTVVIRGTVIMGGVEIKH